ncbi:MAG TPA: hypothetical protein VFV37_02945 [Luteibaculaceae bacterium]|nr:hypothetical protein [Luteibaculaceae bacterium]
MSNFTIVPVHSPVQEKQFLDVVEGIYRDNAAYVRPLDKDLRGIFDRKKNKFFRHGDAARWLAVDESGRAVGRIAAFVNDKYTKQFPGVGGMGFFECINDPGLAHQLMDEAKTWLLAKGMTAMDGPINFGERDRFWGLVIDQFQHAPYYGQNFNPDYYPQLFTSYGFEVYYNQFIYYRKVHDPLQEKFEQRAQMLMKDSRYTVEMINKKNKDKLAVEFKEVYNKAWGKREGEGFAGMSEAQARGIVNALYPIMDNKLGYFAYFEGEPIGFYIAIPEINAIFKSFRGKFGLWQKLQFLYRLKTGFCRTSVGLVFGVAPDHQGKGVEGLLFKKCSEELIRANVYDDVIITWIGDFNIKMINVIESLGGRMHQSMATLRYLFDRNAPFERHPYKV